MPEEFAGTQVFEGLRMALADRTAGKGPAQRGRGGGAGSVEFVGTGGVPAGM